MKNVNTRFRPNFEAPPVAMAAGSKPFHRSGARIVHIRAGFEKGVLRDQPYPGEIALSDLQNPLEPRPQD